MNEITTIGIDLAKNGSQVHGVDARGAVVVRKAIRRVQVLRFFEALPRCLVGMEACATAHYWARAIAAVGHEVRLMPPQYVKAYVKRNKNDAVDAEAICEAVHRPSMRFVAVKSAEQQAVLTMHRARDLLIRQRTMLVNALRAHLAEFGIVGAQGIHRICDLVAIVADEGDERVPAIARGVLRIVADQIAVLQTGSAGIDGRILAWHRSSEVSLRLAGIPGVGPIVASAIASSVPDASVFRSGREFSAWLGLVPKQSGTGGKTWLGRISKRGDGYVRRLLVTGALTALTRSKAGEGDAVDHRHEGASEAANGHRRRTGQQDGSDGMGDDGPGHRVSRIGGLISLHPPLAGEVDSLRGRDSRWSSRSTRRSRAACGVHRTSSSLK